MDFVPKKKKKTEGVLVRELNCQTVYIVFHDNNHVTQTRPSY